ncbi:hypothetical protein JG688_00013535 [Phytophthora aleatoria]|uniref:BZIP domain-containing protein n=1 Tax=Phytophthora aleatoria TaxID=2496075 RepID=A0A8J5M151_9STRA|nr:hypothetical protein JG688_00013535 [Phytophthora aleatoria]
MTEIRHLDAKPVVVEPTSRALLKRLRPRCRGGAEEEDAAKPKRVRRTTATRPRLRNKGKIEILRREIQALESESSMQKKTNLNGTTQRLYGGLSR